jgi:hypothetical protein
MVAATLSAWFARTKSLPMAQLPLSVPSVSAFAACLLRLRLFYVINQSAMSAKEYVYLG